MFDPQEVINKVQLRDYPKDWRVLVVKENWFSIFQTFLVALTLGAILGAIFGAIAEVLSSNQLIGDLVWLVVMLSITGLLGRSVILNKASRYSWFVFLPDGVVECYHGDREKLGILHFDFIKKMDLDHQTTVSVDSGRSSSSSMAVWLNVYFQDGRFMKWDIPDRYGDPIVLGGTIVAAYEYFIQLHGQVQY
jgi:hypothetical protein